ncbi:MAG: hypothetical protein ACFB4I_12930 [Cyanophyceae cyanobacterium]
MTNSPKNQPELESGLLKLTKQEFFAGLALAGLASNPLAFEYSSGDYAARAIEMANEMLKQLSNQDSKEKYE